MKNAEYQGNLSCPQRNSAEHKGYAGAQSVDNREVKEQGGADLLERILSRETLNRAYKRVKANKGAPGIDGMTVEEALPWLREHRGELLEMIRQGKYKPQPVRRKEIPKPDGGVRKLGIPTVVDRIIQQAIAQQRKNIHDKRVIELIKRYLKAGVMENGLRVNTEEGSPQGGPLSPLLANIYLNEYDKEMEKRGVPVIRYADDIVVLSKSKRAAERLLETTQRYLEGKLKLKMNMEKSKVVSVFSIRNFKFLGFALGKGRKGVYVRAHAKSLKKAKEKLKELTSRSQGRNVRVVMQKVKVYIRGWLGYFGIASMKKTMQRWDEWLRRRFRSYIWKQWKLPRTRVKNLMKLGMPQWQAHRNGNSRKGYWAIAGSGILTKTITNKRLAEAGYFEIQNYYESLHLCD